MPLSRIALGVFVLVVAAAVLSFVLNVVKALLIVAAVGVVIGIALSLRPRRPKTKVPPLDE